MTPPCKNGSLAPLLFALGAALSLSSTLGCSDDGDDGASDGANGSDPIYLAVTAVYKPDGGLDNYVNLLPGLEFDSLDLGLAREFPGYAGFAAIGGELFTSDGTAPFVRKFSVADDYSWKEQGRLNFGNYPLDEWNFTNFYFQTIKSQEAVYLFYNQTSRVLWNPTSFEIEADFEDTQLKQPEEEGYTLNNGGNRTGIQEYQGVIMQPFFFANEDWTQFGEYSQIAVYDPDTHEELKIIEVPCPAVQQATQDEAGNVYFSSTFGLPGRSLYGLAPAPCVVKVDPEGNLDEDFTTDLRDWTGGHTGVNFRYLGDGKAIANILHEDRLDADFEGEIDADVIARIDADPTVWELHLIDLEKGTSEVITGFPEENDFGWYTISQTIDGRTFMYLQTGPGAAEGTPETSAGYELLDDATVRKIGDFEGELTGFVKLR